MFFKDKRRADRRWRSRCKFMRRLRSDWSDHGRQSVPVYRRELIGDKYVACEIIGSTLCECFDLTSKQALRFKDTPTGSHSKRACGCSEPLTEYKDARKLPVEREDWRRKPKHREGTRVVKMQCTRCGFLLGRVTVAFGQSPSWAHGSRVCEGCTKAMKKRMSYWRNGQIVEYEKKPA